MLPQRKELIILFSDVTNGKEPKTFWPYQTMSPYCRWRPRLTFVFQSAFCVSLSTTMLSVRLLLASSISDVQTVGLQGRESREAAQLRDVCASDNYAEACWGGCGGGCRASDGQKETELIYMLTESSSSQKPSPDKHLTSSLYPDRWDQSFIYSVAKGGRGSFFSFLFFFKLPA